jgi:transcriptional regulator of acetoin/glycerol metabolism
MSAAEEILAEDHLDRGLVEAARPVIAQLAADVAGAGVAVVLADGCGRVLERAVDGPLAKVLDGLGFAPGYVVAEGAAGSNGLGTAIAARRPVSVASGETIAAALYGISCAAAPVAEACSGRIRGAVGLVSPGSDSAVLMLALAKRAAIEIEQRLVDAAAFSERLLLQRFLQKRRGAKGPLVVLTERTMLGNSAADRLVGPGDEELLRGCARRLTEGRTGEELTVSLAGATVTVRGDAVRDGTSPAIILRLAPVADPRSERSDFAWESLTDTERSIAELVAAGLTNRQAGERLFLSHHTVDFHLRSIFRKLGVRSRVDLARLLVEYQTDIAVAHQQARGVSRYLSALA